MPLAPDMTLAPELEARVRDVARQHGLSPDAALSGLLETILRAEENALPNSEHERAEIAAALARSEEDIAAGRWVALEDLEARHAVRRKAQREQFSL